MMDSVGLTARLVLSVRDKDLAGLVSGVLEGMGFEVLAVTARGVVFQGQRTLFEETFQSSVERTAKGVRFLDEPALPDEFPEQVAFIHFGSDPTYLED